MLAAAAVVAVVAGATAAVRIGAQGHDRGPANTGTPTPTPSTSVSSPTPSTTPSTHHNSQVVAPPAGGSKGSTGSTSTGPPVSTHTITALGVSLDVPKNWALGKANGGEQACITVGGVPEQAIGATAANNCQLSVQVISLRQVAGNGGFFPDDLEVIGQDALCGSGAGAGRVRSVDARNATVGDQQAEYRSYTGDCFKGTWEHWVVPTAPAVVITRSQADPATEAAAQYAVAHASLPGPRSPLRLGDLGVIRSVDSQPDGVHISLDRVNRPEGGAPTNTNSATYPYVLPSNLLINAAMSVDQKPLTVQDLVQLANGKTVHGISPPLSTLLASITTDGDKVVGLSLSVL